MSNQFETFDVATRFAVMRSNIDITIKDSKNVLQALTLLPIFNTAEELQ